MFTFAAMPVKFTGLLILFAFCTVWCVYELTRRQDGRQRVGNVLHLVMAVVMFLMVSTITWQPFVMLVGMPVLVGFFGLATAWFAWRAVGARGGARGVVGHFAGHAAMFAAMTWHLAAMAVKRPHMGPDMASWTMQASQPGGPLWVFALVGVPFMAYLLAASVLDLRRALLPRAASVSCACGDDCTCGADCRCGHAVPASLEVREAVERGFDRLSQQDAERGFDRLSQQGALSQQGVAVVPAALALTCHEPRPVGTPLYRLSALADFAMNFGMFWMSTGLLVALLPFMKLLSF